MVNSRIEFMCVRPEHQTTAPREGLTMHEESWAYCPSADRADHEWQPTGGLTLSEIRSRLAKGTSRHT